MAQGGGQAACNAVLRMKATSRVSLGRLLVLTTGAGGAVVFGFFGCYTGPSVDWEPGGGPSATTQTASPTAEAGTSGLPCDVSALLSTHCATCHSDPPGPGPMALVTYAQLTAPSLGDPSRSVAVLAVDRMRDTSKPMPPAGMLTAADIELFSGWVEAGLPISACTQGDASAPGADAAVPSLDARLECRLNSDCAGTLICRGGVCDVECVTDKDCLPTLTCMRTRCQPRSGDKTGSVDAATD